MKVKGWKNVFKFTYMQMVKSKAYIISTIIIVTITLLMALGLNFLPGLLMDTIDSAGGAGTEGEAPAFKVSTVHISDRSNINPPADFGFLTEMGLTVNMVDDSRLEAVRQQVRDSYDAEILIEITREEWNFSALASRPESEALIVANDCNPILGLIVWPVRNAHILSLGVAQEDVSETDVYVHSQVTVAGNEPRNELAAVITSSLLPMFSAIILFLFIFMYAQFSAQSIATEKTSRVMETLLTSVHPMAIILGKVLGMGLASLTQFIALVGGSVLVSAAVAPFGMIGELFGAVEVSSPDIQMVKVAFDEAFVGFNGMVIVWIIIIFILGFFFYSLIAGLFGATVNRMEDLQSAMQPMALIGVLGFYLAYIAPAFSIGGDVNIVQRISYYLPISSPFALPAVIISGEMSTADIAVSVLILAAFCVLMLMFVSRVYESIILHTGNRIKLGMMFKMAKKK
jgi:ABC-2 type transport system permease protein